MGSGSSDGGQRGQLPARPFSLAKTPAGQLSPRSPGAPLSTLSTRCKARCEYHKYTVSTYGISQLANYVIEMQPDQDGALTAYADDQLLAALQALRSAKRRIDARMLRMLVEVEDRRLELRSAYTSIYDFCRRFLLMSESGAFRRSVAVKMVRRHPALLDHLAEGHLTLSSMVMLDGLLTNENAASLVASIAGKTSSEAKAILVDRAPRPDVPTRLERVVEQASLLVNAPVAEPSRARVEPLGEARYALQMTVSERLHEKLERARDLLSHRQPDRDLGVMMEAAVDLLLAKLEKERLGKAERPRATPETATAKGGVSRAAVRTVFGRDGQRCGFYDENGRRCPSRHMLELDHLQARALGGTDDPDNLAVRCRAHNRLHAEQDFGRAHVEAKIAARRASTPPLLERTRETLRGALVGLGFKTNEAARAVATVTSTSEFGEEPRLPELLRDALRVLAPA
ncbi:MAG: hypothetical protein JWP97_1383 [Labilithrix sp.]|nr:hypothetical protein [Labilithrix sp.]